MQTSEPTHVTNTAPEQELALARLNTLPQGRLLLIEEVEYVIKGTPIKTPSVLQRIGKLCDTCVLVPVKCLYYQLYFLVSPPASEEVLPLEDAPEGFKEGDIVFTGEDLELWFRRMRKITFHPSLGIEFPCFELEPGELRFSPDDVRCFLTGQPFVEYESGETRLLDGLGALGRRVNAPPPNSR